MYRLLNFYVQIRLDLLFTVLYIFCANIFCGNSEFFIHFYASTLNKKITKMKSECLKTNEGIEQLKNLPHPLLLLFQLNTSVKPKTKSVFGL